jgi:Tfp pilus assembly protein PilW
MTTTTPSPTRRPEAFRSARGFTLVELLISAGLAGFILTAVLSSFLFLGRSGANIQNYNDMEAQARRALEFFAQDVRQASSITWNSTTEVRLIVDSASITYGYHAASQQFRRNGVALVTGVTAFEFKAFNITGNELSLADLATAGRSTKQLQVSLSAARTSRTVATATNTVLSARFILRNKRVTT